MQSASLAASAGPTVLALTLAVIAAARSGPGRRVAESHGSWCELLGLSVMPSEVAGATPGSSPLRPSVSR